MASELIWRFGKFGEFCRGGLALGGKSGGGFLIFRCGSCEIGTKCLQNFVAVFDLGELAGDVFAKSDDLGNGLAIFALEAIEEGEAVFDFGQALGRGVDAFGVVAQRGGDIGDGGAGRGELLGRFGKAGVVAGQLFDVADGGAESGFGRGAAFVELIEGAHGGGVELFSVGEDALFGFEGFVFAGFEMRGFDLLALIGPEIDHAQAVLLALEQVVEFVLGVRASERGLRRRRRSRCRRSGRAGCAAASGRSWRGFQFARGRGRARGRAA